jgi:hypothetical protein
MKTILTSPDLKFLNVVKERGVQIQIAAIACAGTWKILFAARVRGAALSIGYLTCWITSDRQPPALAQALVTSGVAIAKIAHARIMPKQIGI